MTEMKQFQEKILYLATAVRSGFAEEGNTAFGMRATYLEKAKTHQRAHILLQERMGNISRTERGGVEELKDEFDGDLPKWNQAFSKLRPPPNTAKRRHSQAGLKLMNKSCEEILQIVGSYCENYESRERKNLWEIKSEEGQYVHHLWHIDDAKVLYGSEEQTHIEFSQIPEEIGESSETPIPRSLNRFLS